MQKTDPNYDQNLIFYNILKLEQNIFGYFWNFCPYTVKKNIFKFFRKIYISKTVEDILNI